VKKRRALVFALAAGAALWLLQTLLVHWAASRNVSGAILAAGPHVPLGDLALAAAMLLARMLALLGAPALVTGAAVWTLWGGRTIADRSP
jgi:hypothetical protein